MCVADRRFRVKSLKTGEVVIYDDKKRHIHLKRDCARSKYWADQAGEDTQGKRQPGE